MTTPKIKFDLQIKYGTEYGLEEEQAVLAVLRQGAPTSGEACIQFERDFAAYCGTAHARAVSNGTAAAAVAIHVIGEVKTRSPPSPWEPKWISWTLIPRPATSTRVCWRRRSIPTPKPFCRCTSTA